MKISTRNVIGLNLEVLLNENYTLAFKDTASKKLDIFLLNTIELTVLSPWLNKMLLKLLYLFLFIFNTATRKLQITYMTTIIFLQDKII